MGKKSLSESNHAQQLFGSKNSALLNALVHASPNQRKAIIQHADKSLIQSICECSLNILNGDIPLRKSEKHSLKKHKLRSRRLISKKKKKSLTKKKQIINQNGGSLLPLVIGPVIAALISKII